MQGSPSELMISTLLLNDINSTSDKLKIAACAHLVSAYLTESTVGEVQFIISISSEEKRNKTPLTQIVFELGMIVFKGFCFVVPLAKIGDCLEGGLRC